METRVGQIPENQRPDRPYYDTVSETLAHQTRLEQPLGLRENATSYRAYGGKAFPKDFNWNCNVCGGSNRAFNTICQYCEHEAFMAGDVD